MRFSDGFKIAGNRNISVSLGNWKYVLVVGDSVKTVLKNWCEDVSLNPEGKIVVSSNLIFEEDLGVMRECENEVFD